MQKIFLVKDENSLSEISNILKEDDDWYVSEISAPNNKGEWLVIIDNEPDDDDEGYLG